MAAFATGFHASGALLGPTLPTRIMARRRNTLIEDVVALAAALPWWVSVGFAVVSFMFLASLAKGEATAAVQGSGLATPILLAAVRGFATIGQWLVPGAFLAGAVVSQFRRVRAARLLDCADDAQSPLTWHEFETLVGEVYRRQGYRVAETPKGADGGVDLVLRRGDELFLVQCKQWQARSVDVKVVRELKGVVAARRAAGGAVVTSGEFTRDAIAFAKEARIDLIDGPRLRAMAKQVSSSHSVTTPSRSTEPNCPKCRASMRLRTAKRGKLSGQQFWGCSTYPKCTGTRALEV